MNIRKIHNPLNYSSDINLFESLGNSFNTKLKNGYFYLLFKHDELIAMSGMYFDGPVAIGGHRTLVNPKLTKSDWFAHTKYITPVQILDAIDLGCMTYQVSFNEPNKRIYEFFKNQIGTSKHQDLNKIIADFTFEGVNVVNFTNQWVMRLDLRSVANVKRTQYECSDLEIVRIEK